MMQAMDQRVHSQYGTAQKVAFIRQPWTRATYEVVSAADWRLGAATYQPVWIASMILPCRRSLLECISVTSADAA